MRRSRWSRTLVVLLLVASVLALVGAGPAPPLGNGPSDSGVPPGLTRVTHIFYGNRAPQKIVQHGPGNVPPPRRQEGSVCPDPEQDGTDQCATNSWSGSKWFVVPVEWSLNLQDADTSQAEGDSPSAFEAAFGAGSDTWENDANSFDATYLGTTGREASSFTGGPSWKRMDGYNDVDFGDLDRYTNAIAVVIYWYYTDSGEIVEADMRMNKDYSWTANGGFIEHPDTTEGNDCCFDVQNIATHEFGHFHAGLNDLYDISESELTMYGYGALGEVKKRTLGVGDELSIASAYPSEATGEPPVADADGPYGGDEDVAIDFDGSESYDLDLGDTLTYAWDFGDGTTGTGVSPSHAYLWGDTFAVILTVDDGNGNTDTATTSATVAEVNDEPVADANGPYIGTVGEAITFDGSGSSDFDNEDGTDANDQVLTYAWAFGDGETGSGVTASHTYAEAGTYTVVLTVTDDDGATDTDSQDVTVSEAGATMHVGDLDGDSSPFGRSGWTATVAITVHDANEHAVGDATVSGTWSDGYSGDASCTTDAEGQCTVATDRIRKSESSVTFTVDTVTHDTLTYDAGANHDPDEGEDGTSITIYK